MGVRAKLEGLLPTGAKSNPPRTRLPPSAGQGPGSLGAAREECQGRYKPQLCGEPLGECATHTRVDTQLHTSGLSLSHTHRHFDTLHAHTGTYPYIEALTHTRTHAHTLVTTQ